MLTKQFFEDFLIKNFQESRELRQCTIKGVFDEGFEDFFMFKTVKQGLWN